MFSSVLRPNLVIFTSDLVVQWSNFKLQNPEYSYTVYSQFLRIFSLYSSRNSIQSKGNFFIHVSSYSWILVGVWDLQLIHDKALVCCCWSFHQKYYLKKRVYIIRIVIIIRHWKKNTGKNLCWIVIVSQWEWVITTAHVKLFFIFFYIDDIVKMAESAVDLQSLLDEITFYTQWNTWNTKKVQFLSKCNVHCLISLKMHNIKTKLSLLCCFH